MFPDGIDEYESVANIDQAMAVELPKWLDAIRLTIGVPDYWEELHNSRELIANIRRKNSGNSPFSAGEQRQIEAQLQEVKKQLGEQFDLSNKQIERIGEQLDEAAEASKRMGRKDWLLLFGGSVLSLILADIVTPGVAEHIFIITIHGLTHLFTDGNEPPQIPPHIIT